MLHIFRHAQSTLNAGLGDTRDCSLTETGILQCKNIPKCHYDLIIVSCLKRAFQTLYHSPLTYDRCMSSELCREKKDGALCNLKANEDATIETDEDVKKRAEEFASELKHLQQIYPRIAVISHHGFIYAFSGKRLNNTEFISMVDL